MSRIEYHGSSSVIEECQIIQVGVGFEIKGLYGYYDGSRITGLGALFEARALCVPWQTTN